MCIRSFSIFKLTNLKGVSRVVDLKDKVQVAMGQEPEEGKTYVITSVEHVKTAVRGFEGIRVTMKSTNPRDKNVYTTMLWSREVAGASSKLGAFLKAFITALGEAGYNTDNWVGKTIRIVSWQPRKREIVVVE